MTPSPRVRQRADLDRAWCSLTSQWHDLRTLTLTYLTLNIGNLADVLSALPALESLRMIGVDQGGYNNDSLVNHLPSALRKLEARSHQLCVHLQFSNRDVHNTQTTFDSVKLLETVILTDKPGNTPHEHASARRGKLDSLCAHLTAVKHLTLYALAVSDVGSLSSLKKLQTVPLVDGYFALDPPLAPQEVLNLLRLGPALDSLSIAPSLVEHWTEQDKDAVEAAVLPNGTELDWCRV